MVLGIIFGNLHETIHIYSRSKPFWNPSLPHWYILIWYPWSKLEQQMTKGRQAPYQQQPYQRGQAIWIDLTHWDQIHWAPSPVGRKRLASLIAPTNFGHTYMLYVICYMLYVICYMLCLCACVYVYIYICVCACVYAYTARVVMHII